MRVLHLASGNLYGGVETLLVTMARYRHLCPDMVPHFALCYEGRLSRELSAEGVPLHFLGAVRASRPWTVFWSRARLRRILSVSPYDVVVSHMCWSHAIFGPAVVPRNRNLVYWAHIDSGATHWTERWASRTKPAMIIANSHFVSKSVGRLFGEVPTSVIYCPVALAEAGDSDKSRTAVRRELGVAPDATVIIQVSRMESWKGQMLHLEALSEIRSVPGWICWIVGGAQRPDEHTYFASLCAKARAAGIADRVLFLGQRSDVPRLLKAADIFCQPNVQPEPFGIVFIEALSAGLPIVTTSMGGATEIVQNTCGLLVPPNQPQALGGALRILIENPEIRTMLGTHGPQRARELCDPESQLNSLYAAFSFVIDSHAAAKVSASEDC